MALEHALLVALRERAASASSSPPLRPLDRLLLARQPPADLPDPGPDGGRRLGRRRTVEQSGRPDKKEYAVTPAGAAVLRDWLAAPTPMEPLRSELAVKLRGAAYGDRAAVLAVARDNLADHALRLAHYEHLATATTPTRPP